MKTGERDALVDELRARLCAAADPLRAEAAAVVFPEKPPILGTPSGLSRQLGKETARRLTHDGDLADVLAVADALFSSGVMEQGGCANELLSSVWRCLGPQHWDTFEHWITLFNCWATTDSFCVKVLAQLVRRDGPPVERLRRWVLSPVVWIRRAALVCLVRAAREGREQQLIYSLSDGLLADHDGRVQKAIGWVLKELCKANPQGVVGYLRSRRTPMTSLAFRYACEGLDPVSRERAKASRER